MFKQLLIVFVHLKSSVYVKNMILQIIHFEYLKVIQHPVYNAMKTDLSSFIEEDGEISLSFLSKWISKNSVRSNRQSTQNKYLSLYFFIDTYHKLKDDILLSNSNSSSHYFQENLKK